MMMILTYMTTTIPTTAMVIIKMIKVNKTIICIIITLITTTIIIMIIIATCRIPGEVPHSVRMGRKCCHCHPVVVLFPIVFIIIVMIIIVGKVIMITEIIIKTSTVTHSLCFSLDIWTIHVVILIIFVITMSADPTCKVWHCYHSWQKQEGLRKDAKTPSSHPELILYVVIAPIDIITKSHDNESWHWVPTPDRSVIIITITNAQHHKNLCVTVKDGSTHVLVILVVNVPKPNRFVPRTSCKKLSSWTPCHALHLWLSSMRTSRDVGVSMSFVISVWVPLNWLGFRVLHESHWVAWVV